MSKDNLVSMVDLLFGKESHEEKFLASMLLGRYKKHLIILEERYLDRWLGKLEGWAEVDSYCDEIDVWLRADPLNRVTILTRWNTDNQIEKMRKLETGKK